MTGLSLHSGLLLKTLTILPHIYDHDEEEEAPSDPCLTDLDRILTEGQDPGAQQYLVLGTVPIKGKNLGFWVPMHLLY